MTEFQIHKEPDVAVNQAGMRIFTLNVSHAIWKAVWSVVVPTFVLFVTFRMVTI